MKESRPYDEKTSLTLFMIVKKNDLDVKSKVHHIAILHDVFFAF